MPEAAAAAAALSPRPYLRDGNSAPRWMERHVGEKRVCALLWPRQTPSRYFYRFRPLFFTLRSAKCSVSDRAGVSKHTRQKERTSAKS